MDDHHPVAATSPAVEHRPTAVAPFETSHQENDDHDDDNNNDEAFAIDAKEMVYAVESFYAIVQPGA
jgi:hypothetical protein